MDRLLDAIIVGAGPAGLSAALILGRCGRDVLVCDGGRPRNGPSHQLHGFLSRDGLDPSELVHIAREQLAPYPGVKFVRLKAASAVRRSGAFEVTLADGRRARARKLLLATGVVDVLPEIPGLRELYGRSVFHCPYCDAWERRGQPLAVYGRGRDGVALAMELRLWSQDLLYCSAGPGELPPALRRTLTAAGVEVRQEGLERLEGSGGALRALVFRGGGRAARRWLFIRPEKRQRSNLAESLGCRLDARGGVRAGRTGASGVHGLFVAGDITYDVQLAVVAAGEGAAAAVALNKELLKEGR